jgi:hypothetical protein
MVIIFSSKLYHWIAKQEVRGNQARHPQLTPVILANQEAEIRRIAVQSF